MLWHQARKPVLGVRIKFLKLSDLVYTKNGPRGSSNISVSVGKTSVWFCSLLLVQLV